jgi:FtsH-binding integral membrane protein
MSTVTLRKTANPAISIAMGRVYKYMGIAVTISMITAYALGTVPFFAALTHSWVFWLLIFAPLLAIFPIGIVLANPNSSPLVLFSALYGFAALEGAAFAILFAHFTLGSVGFAFFSAAILFAVLSAFGYFTQRDLTELGNVLFAALIALIIAMFVNIFIGSSVSSMIISGIAIVIFAGLTAYDTQQIKTTVLTGGLHAEIIGALELYLDFINLFVNLLQFVGEIDD